jgi:HTH-type transcriptional regulator, transcriptional repressor of NAD biosynthesis genes
MSGVADAPARYRLGLVVGKFAPLHLGHERLIQHAARQCDRLLILSYTKPEFARCEVAARRRWLAARFPDHEMLVIDDAWLQDACAVRGIEFRPLPDNGADDPTQQRTLAWLLHDVLGRAPDAMFSSEAYGPPCARVLSDRLGHRVDAVVVDPERVTVPIRARHIRQDPQRHAQWLAPVVRAAFVRRVVVLGGESSGKTTLAAALAAHFATVWAPEYGRELWTVQGGVLSEPDLLRIARTQVAREESALLSARGLLFCDTSPLTTFGYSRWMFGRADAALAKLAARAYDAAVLCGPDFPFVQDGTRRDAAFRDMQHAWYRAQTRRWACPVLEVRGPTSQRVATVAAWLTHSAQPVAQKESP